MKTIILSVISIITSPGKEMYLFFGAVVGAVAAYITAKVTSEVQLRIAEDNSKKDMKLQEQRLADERLKAEVMLEREKLEKLHVILSKIRLENSQTKSFLDKESGVLSIDFRERYLANCERLHEAHAITDLYYPQMSDSLKEIYAKTNRFWGAQEAFIRADIQKNQEDWDQYFNKVLDVVKEIADHVWCLQEQIASRGKVLNEALRSSCDV